MRSISELIDWHARRTPDRTAIRDHHGTTLTYAELARRVRVHAVDWQDRGIDCGDRVAFVAKNSLAYILNLLALRHLGSLPVLLNWRLSPGELEALIGLVEPSAVVGDEALLRGLRGATVPMFDIDQTIAAPQPTRAAPPAHVDRDRADAPFAILHTSGTTGLPKLIPLTNRGQVENVWSMRLRSPGLGGGRRHLRHAPMFHMAGLNGVTVPLALGDELHLLPQFDPEAMVEVIAGHRIEYTNAPPAALGPFLDAIERRDPRPDLSSLVEIWYGTAPIATPLLERALGLLQCGFRQHYGMTEAQIAVSGLEPEDHRRGGRLLMSAGRPLPGFDLRLVDPELRDVEPGDAGELLIRGEMLFPGYWGDPARTADAMEGDWYRTGDIGRFDDDGYLYIVDRAKDMIVSGGENVYPAEVEAMLIDHPDVVQVAVVGVPHPRWGETVHAVVVARDGATVDGVSLISWARERFAHFKCPTSVEFVAELPRNAIGKVDKKVLRAPHWEGHDRAVG